MKPLVLHSKKIKTGNGVLPRKEYRRSHPQHPKVVQENHITFVPNLSIVLREKHRNGCKNNQNTMKGTVLS